MPNETKPESINVDLASGPDENVITKHEPEAKPAEETETQELSPAPALNPHGRVTGEVTTDLETGKIIKASYPQDGAATHK